MFPWQQVLHAIINKTFAVFFEPMLWVVLVLLTLQYRRMQKTQLRMFGDRSHSLRHQVVLAAFWGSVGGIIGGVLLTFFGVTINNLGFEYIWPLAIILMAINMRFICFAYAGGLVALSCVLFGWPNVNVPQVLALVAILHIVESFLIIVSSRHSATPLILRLGNGRLVGAFSLQNFWPLPLVVLMAISTDSSTATPSIFSLLDWWPILPGALPAEGHHWLYGTLPVVAALGYTDMAVASTPAQRRRESALHLAMYSVLLLILAVASATHTWLQLLAALLSPLGHELLIQMDNRRETSGRPIYVPALQGVMILDRVLDSTAEKIGLRSGDIIRSIAYMEVNNARELADAIDNATDTFNIVWERNGRKFEKTGKFIESERRLGVILVPEGGEQNYVEMQEEKFEAWEWLKRRMRR